MIRSPTSNSFIYKGIKSENCGFTRRFYVIGYP
nr:MAG TPA: hypothetical protein [Caudoviricetes sp.]